MNDFSTTITESVLDAIDMYIEQIVEKTLTEERLFTIPEIARLSGYSETAIRNYINRDHNPLPAFQVDKEYRIRYRDFSVWLEAYKTNRARIPT